MEEIHTGWRVKCLKHSTSDLWATPWPLVERCLAPYAWSTARFFCQILLHTWYPLPCRLNSLSTPHFTTCAFIIKQRSLDRRFARSEGSLDRNFIPYLPRILPLSLTRNRFLVKRSSVQWTFDLVNLWSTGYPLSSYTHENRFVLAGFEI